MRLGKLFFLKISNDSCCRMHSKFRGQFEFVSSCPHREKEKENTGKAVHVNKTVDQEKAKRDKGEEKKKKEEQRFKE